MGLPDNALVYSFIPIGKREAAVKFLSKFISIEDKRKIRKEIEKEPVRWFAPYHFDWGMKIRNELRQTGFDEQYFMIKNLDDIYVELVENAVKEDE
jgi:hypothetical protein